MKYIIKNIGIAILLLLSTAGKSQTLVPGSEIMEMIMLAETYRTAPDLSFNVQIKYSDSVMVDSAIEQITASYKLHAGLFHTYADSNEIVQGNKYCIRVSHTDSVISISERQQYPDVMNMPVTDTLYWKMFVESITVTQPSDSLRILKIKFRRGAQYSSYEVKYNYKQYLIYETKCYMPAGGSAEDAALYPSGKALMKFTFSNYSTEPISSSWFNEDKFISKQGGQFLAKAPYVGYFIENTITQP